GLSHETSRAVVIFQRVERSERQYVKHPPISFSTGSRRKDGFCRHFIRAQLVGDAHSASSVLTIHNGPFEQGSPLDCNFVPIECLYVFQGGARHPFTQITIPQQQPKFLVEIRFRVCEKAGHTMANKFRLIQIHCEARQSASRRLTQHLRMPLKLARKYEYMRLAHFVSQRRLRKVSEERDVFAPELPG